MLEVLVRSLRQKDEIVPQVDKQEVKLTLYIKNSSLFFKDPKIIQNKHFIFDFFKKISTKDKKQHAKKSVIFLCNNN